MFNNLFYPMGTISNRDYWRACAALCGLTLFAAMSFVWFLRGHQDAFVAAALLILALFYFYTCFCVYGKRLHTIGLSRLWCIGIFIVGIGVSRFMGYLLSLDVAAKFSVSDDLMRVMATYTEPSLGFYALAVLLVFLGVGLSVVPVIICSLLTGMIKGPSIKGPKVAAA